MSRGNPSSDRLVTDLTPPPGVVVLPDGTTSDVMKEATLAQVHTVNGFMDEVEQELADDFYDAIMRFSRESPRSKQAGRFQVGVSDLGFCPERTRRMLDGQTPEPTDVLLAFLGTAIGDFAEQAWKAKHPTSVTQAEVAVTFRLSIDDRLFEVQVPGHPDIIVPEDGLLLDVKTDYGLADSEKIGPSKQQQFQRHCYGWAAWEAGLFDPGVDSSDVLVGNVWIDRAGQDKRVHVNLEPLRTSVLDEAKDWLEDVVYHLVEQREAAKVPPRDMCQVVCGFYGPCRGGDTDVEGLITDPETLERIAEYIRGRDMKREGERITKQIGKHLEGVRGSTGDVLVRPVMVGESYVPGFTRRGYTKIDIRPVPKGRKR